MSCLTNIKANEVISYATFEQWYNTLQPAKVTNWSSLIPSPGRWLQSAIKQALTKSGCPACTCQNLVLKSHENLWPVGIWTPNSRKNNESNLSNYSLKRIPEQQAVIVFGSDNKTLSEDMVDHIGHIMIFVNGVETVTDSE
ncbi:E3 ubiquitin-protein ligase NRDP1-like [Adelges cooleyi]|uniref:E3 ubiquitin-protein ligase NRDP1-like n=1 Tax=Adelges cooleyi TaxID=133065 RepID=UPI00217F45C5|nr:E3 ubiquitin-protein ligase NRDP1-like [Adelges cooleyi]